MDLKIGLLKVRGYAILVSIVLCVYVFLCLVCFLFVVWLCRFGYGMDEVMMY